MEIREHKSNNSENTMRLALLLINCLILAVGNCAGPLMMRLYFIHGGKRVWFSSWLETAAWPIILVPLSIMYHQRRKTAEPTSNVKLITMKLPVFVGSAIIGTLTGFDDYFYAYGVGRLPVSTSSLIIATQLAFTAGFALLLVKQRFTSYSINAVFLLTIGAGVLALHTSSDRPKNESSKEYVMGFMMTVIAAALYGLILPLVELMYKKAKEQITYTLVLEVQVVMCFFATVVCTVGMLVNNDFQVIGREARAFELGAAKYYIVVTVSAMIWQCFFLGAIGVIYCGSSLLSAVLIAVLLPVTEILAVIFYRESFQAEKGVALALSLWGFASYFYGERKKMNKEKKRSSSAETEMPPALEP